MENPSENALAILQNGAIEIKGEFIWGSNYTFLAQVEHAKGNLPCVYKPSKGERPLWDFPPASLTKREVAAFLVSEAIGWHFVPPTVYREDAPFGGGSVQLYIDHDPEYHYFTFEKEDQQRLRPVALFDYLINNADRKGGHVLIGPDGHLWLIDHGVCFHVQDKLRTVIWDFAGELIPEVYCEDLNRFYKKLIFPDHEKTDILFQLSEYLSAVEIRALARRTNQLIAQGVFPAPDPHRRHYPWPQL